MPRLRPVLLSGGSGKRLWPLSTPERPKQFAPLLGDESLFSATLRRLEGLDTIPVIVVTGSRHRGLVEEQLAEAGHADATVLAEPRGRNTGPAVLAASLIADPGDVLAVLPSDALVTDIDAFHEAMEVAVGLAEEGFIATFGVVPTRPDSGFGYIETGDVLGAGRRIGAFVEKPDTDRATQLIDSGGLWNSGMFVFTADTVLEEARSLRPEMVSAVGRALEEGKAGDLGPSFGEIDAISFDHAVMEHTDRGAVVPLDAGWSDVGTYRALMEVGPRDEHGNFVYGPVEVANVTNSFLYSSNGPLLVTDLAETVVVSTDHGSLVAPLDDPGSVRMLTEQLGA